MQFRNIIGKENLKKQLILACQQGRVSHAQLFHGAAGHGVLPLALSQIQYLACSQRTDEDSCGSCSDCKQIQQLQHPDLHLFFPVATSKEKGYSTLQRTFAEVLTDNEHLSLPQWLQVARFEKKQATLNVEQANQINRALQLNSYSGGNKYVVIWQAERMNTAALNKILKTLEEPSDRTYFYLIAQDPNSLLNTILSRCQQMYIPPYTEQELILYLEREKVDANIHASIVQLSDGDVNQAMSLAGQSEELLNFALSFKSWSRACYAANSAKFFDWGEELARESRDTVKRLLQYFSQTLAISFNSSFQPNAQNPTIFQTIDFDLLKFAPFITLSNSPLILEKIDEAIQDIDRNVNPKLVLADLSIAMSRLLRQS